MRLASTISALLLVLQISVAIAQPTKLIVRWKENTKPDLPPQANAKALRMPNAFVEDPLPGESVTAAVARRLKNPNVLDAEPDHIQTIDMTANDLLTSQYGMAKIGITAAWDMATGSSSTKVCVIDTGVDYNHPDLTNTVQGWDYVQNTAGGMDANNHGTHTAGVIGATTNNGAGVAGVNWNVTIVPCRFLDATGSGATSNAINCLYYCDSVGAKITSNSWGSTASSSSLRTAILDLCNKGSLFVGAAGNYGVNNDVAGTLVSYPAAYNLACQVTVAATDNVDALATFSSYGPTSTHLAAPGVSIYSTLTNGSYGYMSGTSMATPYVAGVAALLSSSKPTLTAAELKAKILGSVAPVAALAGKVSTGGRLDAAKTLSSTTVPAAPVCSIWTMSSLMLSTRYTTGTALQVGLKTTTDIGCSNACKANASCRTWSWDKRKNGAFCYLYSVEDTAQTRVTDKNFVSGKKLCSAWSA